MTSTLPKPTMTRTATEEGEYVISSPTGFTGPAGRFGKNLYDLSLRSGLGIIDGIHETSDKLGKLNPDQIREIKSEFPGLVIEPNIRYRLFRHPFLDTLQELSWPASMSLRPISVRVLDAGTRQPVPNTTVHLISDDSRRETIRGMTDAAGVCQLRIPGSIARLDSILLDPQVGYWSRRVQGVPVTNTIELTVTALPAEKPENYDWGHDYAGMRDGIAQGGAGVKVAIIDTGIDRTHPDLKPEGGENCVRDEQQKQWYDDDGQHGTHCAGVVAAQLNGIGLKGYAPGVTLRSYRVFPSNGAGATTFDIAKAIVLAVEQGCDILSLSLGSSTAQSAIRSKIEFAYDKGVVCIAAAGNDATGVGYPAAFPNVIAVAAFGQLGSYPEDSLHKAAESQHFSADQKYFVANFSNFGDQIDFIAPGVAIRSTVPGGYSVWDGTSMACPHIAGIAALTLASDPKLLAAPRDPSRVEGLLQRLTQHSQALGFTRPYEGFGSVRLQQLMA